MNLDIPNLQNANLHDSFQIVVCPIVNSTNMYCILNLDVSELLFPKVYYYDFIQSLDSTITSIVIPNWTCNDIDYTIFDFSRFTEIESIEIGDDCFGSVQTFQIDGLNRLKIIKIGNNSFTHVKGSDWDNNNNNVNSRANDKSKSFHILNCESLKSIQIGEYSFSDFGGEFELKNLPQLQSIHIGAIMDHPIYGYRRRYYNVCFYQMSDLFSFCSSNFNIGGIDISISLVFRSKQYSIHFFRR